MAHLAIEFLSIASYILVSYLKFQPRSTEAGLKHFLFGAISAAVMLYGISLLYGTDRHDGAVRQRDLSGIGPALAAGLERTPGGSDAVDAAPRSLTWSALGFKVAMVPFHLWVPTSTKVRRRRSLPGCRSRRRLRAWRCSCGSSWRHCRLRAGARSSPSWPPLTMMLGQRRRLSADQHQADAGLLQHRARRLRADGAGRLPGWRRAPGWGTGACKPRC